ncbi:MAG: sulfite exporter TauE/SafE family protein [Gemmatimonadetes bacterium]|nr:sulfite exporter TauE/SafE family protein [Gemmatimonadota bacterium]
MPVKPAIAMSLAVVGMSAGVGFLSHWRQGTVHLRVAIPFRALCHGRGLRDGAAGATRPRAGAARALRRLRGDRRPDDAARFDANRAKRGSAATEPRAADAHFTAPLALQALSVGALTSLIGAGGGFVIVPALVLLARLPVREAVGSSLLIITMNALSGFVGYIGQVPINWGLVASFTGVAAVGALIGTRLVRRVPQHRIKQGFAVMILVLGTYFALRKLHVVP